MNMTRPATGGSDANWVAALQRFVRPAAAADERCELCGRAIGASHQHLLVAQQRRTLCACTACASQVDRSTDGALLRIPPEVVALPAFRLDDAQWDALLIPIDLAFFFESSAQGRIVAMYPGPSGLVESLLDLAAWRALVAANPVLAGLRADVQALLVCRVGSRRQYWLAPIDRCFELAGLMRLRWHGLSGGAEVWRAIEQFFIDLAAGAGAVHSVALDA